LIIVTIGSTLLVMGGRTIYGWVKFPKTQRYKLASELFYGALIATVIIAGIGGVGASAVITLGIYYSIIAIVVQLLARLKWYGGLVRE